MTPPWKSLRAVTAIVIALTCGVNASSGNDTLVYTEVSPEWIAEQIGRLKKGQGLRSVMESLGNENRAAPYLRMIAEPGNNERDYRRDVSDVLDVLDRARHDRNRSRFSAWSSSGRFDLCVDLLAQREDERASLDLVRSNSVARQRIEKEWGAVSPWKQTQLPRFGSEFKADEPFKLRSGAQVTVPESTDTSAALVLADRCEVEVFRKDQWFVAVRNSLLQSGRPEVKNGIWIDSFVCVNNSCKFPRLKGCLIICDGDVVLHSGVENSVVIANGSVTGGGYHSWIHATESVQSRAMGPLGDCYFSAGETVKFAAKYVPTRFVMESRPQPPFGVKFVDPKEFGLELALQNGGVQVMGITPESPFTKFGVEKSDVITKIDDVTPKSLADFRRALRRGIIRESVILHIKRDGKDITRIVYLDGIPLPVAPPPRPVQRP